MRGDSVSFVISTVQFVVVVVTSINHVIMIRGRKAKNAIHVVSYILS